MHRNTRVWWLTVLVSGVWATGAAAGIVTYRPNGQTLTQAGWTLAGTPNDQMTKSKDYSTVVGDAWNINDNNTGPIGNAYMRMYKDPGPDNQNPGDPPLGTLDWSQGMMLCRAKFNSGGSTGGSFGFSIAAHNMSIVVALRNGSLAIKDAEGNSSTVSNPVVPGGTTGWRVYGLQNHLDGGSVRYDLWVSNGDQWSSNPADWTQLIDEGGFGAISALIDETGTARTGLLLGSFGSSSTAWNGDVSSMTWAKDGDRQTPWTLPEPSSLALLVFGGWALASRRR